MALKLDVDFSHAGVTLGSSGISFGDLILTGSPLPVGLDLDGLTVAQLLKLDNAVLGGTVTISDVDLANLDALTAALDFSFDGGTPSIFAQEFLVALNGTSGGGGTPMPEPSSMLLLATGLIGILGFARTKA